MYSFDNIDYSKNKEERYSDGDVSNTRYSAKGTKGKWRYICKQQSDIKMRQLPAVDRFNLYTR